jgi:hypothetical protein
MCRKSRPFFLIVRLLEVSLELTYNVFFHCKVAPADDSAKLLGCPDAFHFFQRSFFPNSKIQPNLQTCEQDRVFESQGPPSFKCSLKSR